jgi:hypothetical protein
MREKLELKDTPLPDGFRCLDCELFGYCNVYLDIAKMFDKACKFSPSKFEKKQKVDKTCAFYCSGQMVGPNMCGYFGTSENDINCYKCKKYIRDIDVNKILRSYIDGKDE